MKLLGKNISVILMVVVLGFSFSFVPQTYAQVPYKISADKPAGGTSTPSSDSGSDDTVYIVAGIAVAAIIGYTLYKKYSAPEEKDTTSSKTSSIQQLLNTEKNSYSNMIQEFKEKIPIDIHFGMKNSSTINPDKTFLVGLTYRF